MKTKFINGNNWEWLDTYSSKYIHVEDIFNGFISLVKVYKVKHKITIDYEQSDVCLFDDGYKCLVFLPDEENWCLSVVYNTCDEIIEYYFDMTKENSIDAQGIPYFIDLYLDIAVSPDFRITILDEEELKEALELNIITKSVYDMAHNTCNKIVEEIIPNKDFLISFFYKFLVFLEH